MSFADTLKNNAGHLVAAAVAVIAIVLTLIVISIPDMEANVVKGLQVTATFLLGGVAVGYAVYANRVLHKAEVTEISSSTRLPPFIPPSVSQPVTLPPAVSRPATLPPAPA